MASSLHESATTLNTLLMSLRSTGRALLFGGGAHLSYGPHQLSGFRAVIQFQSLGLVLRQLRELGSAVHVDPFVIP